MRIFILFLSIAIFFIACETERQSPIDTVRANYAAMGNEDIAAYLETVTGARSAVAETLLSVFFEDYDVAYSIDSIELAGEIGNVAQVRTVVTSTDRGGPNKFHDNRMTATHKLRLERGKWRIFFSEVEKPEMLEQRKPEPEDTVIRHKTS